MPDETKQEQKQRTDLRIIAVPGLVVEHVEKRLGPRPVVAAAVRGRDRARAGRRWPRLAEHVAGVH